MQPYPEHLVKSVALHDGAVMTIRPLRRDDAALEQEFVRNLSEESRFYRFMDGTRELNARMLARLIDVDYDRHMALVAVIPADEREVEIGVARYVAEPGGTGCEFAIVVADAWQRRGVGTALMRTLMDAARACGRHTMHGEVLAGNGKMLRFAQRLGFRPVAGPDAAGAIRIETQL